MVVKTENFLITYNDRTKKNEKSLSYYNIFNLSLPLVKSNICDVNKKENNNIIDQR